MIGNNENKDFESSAREIAREISDFRREWIGRLCEEVADEVDEVEKSGFDPAKGRGRGPAWATGD